MLSTVIFTSFLAFGGIVAQVPSPVACPNYEPLSNFNISRYLGKWYEIERFFAFFEVGSKCNTAEYSLNNNGTAKIRNRQINAVTGAVSIIEGVARPIGRAGDAKFGVSFPTDETESSYLVLGTDYDNYGLMWTCSNFGSVSSSYSWVFSRTPIISPEAMRSVNSLITKYGISKASYQRTDQTNCPKSIDITDE